MEWVVNATPRTLYAEERDPSPRRMGGPQGGYGRLREIPLSWGLHPWTVQPSASRYTDWTIPAHKMLLYEFKGFAITFTGHTELGKTPLDEWSAHRRDLPLPENTQQSQQTSML